MPPDAKKMHQRLSALVRKAKLKESDPVAVDLLTTLSKELRTKREYEDALGTEEGAEAYAKKHGFTLEQQQIFLAMQQAKDIFTPNPILDGILTAAFLAQVALIGIEMWRRDMFFVFLLLCFLIDAVVARVQHTSSVVGNFLSTRAAAFGLVDAPPLAGKIQMKKWQEQSWQLFVHSSMALMEGLILADEDWWREGETCWIPHPFEQRASTRLDLQIFYTTQLAIWMYTCFMHRFVDERRKDYFVMYVHHIFTIALVAVSWAVGYMRVGLLVLWVHDVSDIFVDLLKMVNYLKLEDKRGYFASEIAYVACVVSWMYWRLYQYPGRVLNTAILMPYTVLRRPPLAYTGYMFMGVELFPGDLPWHSEMCVLLVALLGLHIYWFHLFLMIGYRILTESAREASRQEYEGDSDDEGATPSNQHQQQKLLSKSSSRSSSSSPSNGGLRQRPIAHKRDTGGEDNAGRVIEDGHTSNSSGSTSKPTLSLEKVKANAATMNGDSHSRKGGPGSKDNANSGGGSAGSKDSGRDSERQGSTTPASSRGGSGNRH